MNRDKDISVKTFDETIKDVSENIIYGKSPLDGIFFDKSIKKAIKQIKYSRIKKYSPIRKVKGKRYARPFYTSWIIPIVEIKMTDLDLKMMEQTEANSNAIYNAYGVPKELIGK